jgi:molybdopterin/thiamine biosynthesis adenylyltransferase
VSDSERVLLVLSEMDYRVLRRELFTEDGCENFAVLFCGAAVEPGITRLLARHVWIAPSDAYSERLSYHLEISPRFLNSAVDYCLRTGLSPVLVHSHRAGVAAYSGSDDFGERRLLPVLQKLMPQTLPASLLLTESDAIGRVHRRETFDELLSVQVKGIQSRFFERRRSPRSYARNVVAAVDRQMRAIGAAGQEVLGRLSVGVVGVGGTGSAVAEQLTRMGVGAILLIDHDSLARSNLSRVWGTVERDYKRQPKKVEIISRHLKRIRPNAAIASIVDTVVRQSVVARLRNCDLVFCCTDNHWSRAVLNRFSHQYLVPVVDMGIRLDARAGSVTAVGGRITIVGSGMTCLRCSNHIDPARVRTESLPSGERDALVREGYIQGIADPEPAVISLNTTIAGIAVSAGMGLFANLVGAPPPLDQVYDATRGSLFTVSPRHDVKCDVCSESEGVKALGDSQVVSAYE